MFIINTVTLWLRKSLDHLSKAEKISTSSYHQPFISSLQLGINLALVKPQILPWKGGEKASEKEKGKKTTDYWEEWTEMKWNEMQWRAVEVRE